MASTVNDEDPGLTDINSSSSSLGQVTPLAVVNIFTGDKLLVKSSHKIRHTEWTVTSCCAESVTSGCAESVTSGCAESVTPSCEKSEYDFVEQSGTIIRNCEVMQCSSDCTQDKNVGDISRELTPLVDISPALSASSPVHTSSDVIDPLPHPINPPPHPIDTPTHPIDPSPHPAAVVPVRRRRGRPDAFGRFAPSSRHDSTASEDCSGGSSSCGGSVVRLGRSNSNCGGGGGGSVAELLRMSRDATQPTTGSLSNIHGHLSAAFSVRAQFIIIQLIVHQGICIVNE